MTEPEPEYEYGVEWRYRSGNSFVSPMTERAARKIVDEFDPRLFNPHPVAVVRRPVAAWSPVPPEGKQATK